MSGHDEVERALRADAASLTPPGVTLDAAAAARGARRRRMPVQAAVGTLGVLAIVGFGGIAVSAMSQWSTSDSATDAGGETSAESPEAGPLASPETTAPDEGAGGGDDLGTNEGTDEGPSEGSDGDTARTIFTCGGPLPPAGHGADAGLALEVLPLDADDASEGRLPVTVTLTNTTDGLITGTSAIWPHLALALNDEVVWHTAGGMDGVAVNLTLGPNQSVRYETHLDLIACQGPAGDVPFPRDLPAAESGEYEVVAALDVTAPGASASATGTELVISPRASLTVP